ncbi:MAG: type II toxin-antitoxin system RelB/DinJ family antitoxin [Rhizobiaceae bacterium]
MPANAVVRARIEESLKEEASAVLADMGLTVSDLVRITLTRVAKDKALPFDLKVPNAQTRAAMSEARSIAKKGAHRFADGNTLIDALDDKER